MQLPGPIRAAVGLLASAADEARRLPDLAIELPMLAVSTALQASLRAQQRYARLAARGDAVLNRQPMSDEPPPWARFDEPAAAPGGSLAGAPAAPEFGRGDLAVQLMAELFDDATATGPESAQYSDGSGAVEERRPAPHADTSTTEPGSKSVRKSVKRPRHAPPSAFDAIGDTATDTAGDDRPDPRAAG